MPIARTAFLQERELWLATLRELHKSGKKSLSILLLGKSGTGKSATINSMLNESTAVRVSEPRPQPRAS